MGIPTLVCSACVVLIPLALLTGAVFGLPALFPPLRDAARADPGVRKALAVVAGLAAFALGYAGWAFAYTNINYNLAIEVYIEADCRQERCLRHLRAIYDNRDAIGVELWQRMLVPPPLRSACYSGEADLCALADETYWGAYSSHVSPGRTWGEYLSVLAFSLLPAAAAILVVMRLTIPRRVEPLRSFAALRETTVHPDAGQGPTSPAPAAASRSPALRRSSR